MERTHFAPSVRTSLVSFCMLAVAASAPAGEQSSEEYRIGVMVRSIQNALAAPEKAESLTTIVEYGHDSRYYVMIRGWLVQELASVESIQESAPDAETKARSGIKRDFLRKAIRRIDLE